MILFMYGACILKTMFWERTKVKNMDSKCLFHDGFKTGRWKEICLMIHFQQIPLTSFVKSECWPFAFSSSLSSKVKYAACCPPPFKIYSF